jgi:tetratricopeptide (TPR) repeat protein
MPAVPARIIVTALLLLVLSVSVLAQRTFMPLALHEQISTSIDLILRQEYASADSVLRNAIVKYPDHPAGYLFLIGLLQAKALDYEELLDPYQLRPLFEEAQKKIDTILRADPDDAWGNFFQGTLHLYDSFLRVQRGEWFGVVSKALASAASLRKALEADSTLVDAYAGLGTYLYWKSRKIEFLHWLPFVSDDREEAIAMLERCASGSVYNTYVAMNSLINIFLEEKRYHEAIRFAEMALASYPTNRSFLWGKATALDRMGIPDQATSAYTRLLEQILSDHRENRYNELVCRLNLAKNLLALKHFIPARTQLLVVKGMKKEQFRPHLRERAESKLKEATALLESLSKNGFR